jgi:hypothetical protein
MRWAFQLRQHRPTLLRNRHRQIFPRFSRKFFQRVLYITARAAGSYGRRYRDLATAPPHQAETFPPSRRHHRARHIATTHTGQFRLRKNRPNLPRAIEGQRDTPRARLRVMGYTPSKGTFCGSGPPRTNRLGCRSAALLHSAPHFEVRHRSSPHSLTCSYSGIPVAPLRANANSSIESRDARILSTSVACLPAVCSYIRTMEKKLKAPKIADETGMAERFQRGLQPAVQMPHKPITPKAKTRPVSKGRVHKGKTGR